MATLIAPRYSAEDFETGSIRSAAPSYVSEVPSYHSRPSTDAPPPSYTPRQRERTFQNRTRRQQQPAQQQTIGLPPIPPAPAPGVPSLHHFNIPTWSTRNAQSARQLHSVIERRANAEASNNNRPETPRRGSSLPTREEEPAVRPLEDPYLVGEEAAARAKQERLTRERDENILQMEDKQWDWLLTQMRTWDERERSWARFRHQVETPRRKNLLRRMGGRLI